MSKSVEIDAEAVITRIKVELGITKDTELANMMEISNKTISSWRKRNSIPIEILLQATVATGRKIDYFLFGKEEPRQNTVTMQDLLSDENFRNFKILGRSTLITVLSEYAEEELAFLDEEELAEKGDSLGATFLLSLSAVQAERKALVDNNKMSEEEFVEYASKMHQPALPYFAAGIKARHLKKTKGPQ